MVGGDRRRAVSVLGLLIAVAAATTRSGLSSKSNAGPPGSVDGSCQLIHAGCKYSVIVQSTDAGCGRYSGRAEGPGGPSAWSAPTNGSTAGHGGLIERLDELENKMARMLKELSVRSLRHLRQIKTDLRKIAASIKESRSTGGGPAAGPGSASTGSSSVVPCLPEFQRVGAWPSCYRFSAFNATWHEAREYCSAFGANLLALDSLKEAHIIDYLLNSKPEYQSRENWWTSGNYMVRNQRWMWTSKHHLKPITYSRWAADEVTVDVNSNMHCLLLSRTLKYYWQEANCTEKHTFICEVDDV